jgi:DNA-binding response OmpR family regulator
MHSVLLVEDDPMLQELYKKVLETEFLIYTASDGQAGLDESLNKHPDLILLDLSLPILNGLEVMKKLREDAWGANAKIIIMTNQDTTDEILNAVSEGKPEYYFLKSNVTPQGIVLKLKEVFEKSAS